MHRTRNAQTVVLKVGGPHSTVPPEPPEKKRIESSEVEPLWEKCAGQHMEQGCGVDLAADRQAVEGTGERGNGGSTLNTLWTSDGVCLGEVGSEGTATHVPRVSILVTTPCGLRRFFANHRSPRIRTFLHTMPHFS